MTSSKTRSEYLLTWAPSQVKVTSQTDEEDITTFTVTLLTDRVCDLSVADLVLVVAEGAAFTEWGCEKISSRVYEGWYRY